MKKGTILTIDDVKRLYKCLKTNTGGDCFWVDNENFYKSNMCKAMFGRNPTLKEISMAKKRENGYITQLRGKKIYLVRKIESYENPHNS